MILDNEEQWLNSSVTTTGQR